MAVSKGSGSIRFGKGGIELALKQNQAFAQQLNQVMRQVPKRILGVYAATALDLAIKSTFQDSGRAAANWNIAFKSIPTTAWDPAKYRDPVGLGVNQGGSAGRVGERGDQRTYSGGEDAVRGAKALNYGYTQVDGYMYPTEHGLIHTKLRIGKSGQAPTTFIYNPILSPDVVNKHYRLHAFSKTGELSAEMLSGSAALSSLPAKFGPRLIHELSASLKTKYVMGTI